MLCLPSARQCLAATMMVQCRLSVKDSPGVQAMVTPCFPFLPLALHVERRKRRKVCPSSLSPVSACLALALEWHPFDQITATRCQHAHARKRQSTTVPSQKLPTRLVRVRFTLRLLATYTPDTTSLQRLPQHREVVRRWQRTLSPTKNSISSTAQRSRNPCR